MTARDFIAWCLFALAILSVYALISFGAIDPDDYRRPYGSEHIEQEIYREEFGEDGWATGIKLKYTCDGAGNERWY